HRDGFSAGFLFAVPHVPDLLPFARAISLYDLERGESRTTAAQSARRSPLRRRVASVAAPRKTTHGRSYLADDRRHAARAEQQAARPPSVSARAHARAAHALQP